MTITNTWAVQQMDAYQEYEGETDVVFTVHWTLTATDGTYSGNVYATPMLRSHLTQTSLKRKSLAGLKKHLAKNP